MADDIKKSDDGIDYGDIKIPGGSSSNEDPDKDEDIGFWIGRMLIYIPCGRENPDALASGMNATSSVCLH